MIGRQVKGGVADKEKAMVDHDVMKLEVRRLRDILAMHADEVFSLENRKFQLKMSLEERKHEIEVHRWAGWGWGGREGSSSVQSWSRRRRWWAGEVDGRGGTSGAAAAGREGRLAWLSGEGERCMQALTTNPLAPGKLFPPH